MLNSFSEETLNKKVSNLTELLRHRAIHQPDKTAYIFLKDGESEEIRLTYQELDRQARSVAVHLQGLKAAGERALLLYPPSLNYIAAFFGCLYAGVVAVPMYPPHPTQPARSLPKLKGIAKNARPLVSITLSSIQTALEPLFSDDPDLGKMHWLATDNLSDDIGSDWQDPAIRTDAPAFFQYTSGSTGLPKGVMVSHANLLHNSGLIRKCFGHTHESRGVIWLPPYHDMGLIGGVLQPLFLRVSGRAYVTHGFSSEASPLAGSNLPLQSHDQRRSQFRL